MSIASYSVIFGTSSKIIGAKCFLDNRACRWDLGWDCHPSESSRVPVALSTEMTDPHSSIAVTKALASGQVAGGR